MKGIAFVVLLPAQNEKRMFLVQLSYGFNLKKIRHGSFFALTSPQSHFSEFHISRTTPARGIPISLWTLKLVVASSFTHQTSFNRLSAALANWAGPG